MSLQELNSPNKDSFQKVLFRGLKDPVLFLQNHCLHSGVHSSTWTATNAQLLPPPAGNPVRCPHWLWCKKG